MASVAHGLWTESALRRGTVVILVTVGMHTDGFGRLVEAMDQIAAQSGQEVMMQIGATPYRPSTASWFDFATQEEMDKLCERARIIVSHTGAGSVLTAIRHHKPLIVVPRLKKYGEHIDDHQLELARALSEAGVLLVAYETSELPDKLEAAKSFAPRTPHHRQLVEAVRRAALGNAQESK